MRDDSTEPNRWESLVRAWGLSIPRKRLEAISPVLDRFSADVQRALDRDLSRVDPAFRFTAERAGDEG